MDWMISSITMPQKVGLGICQWNIKKDMMYFLYGCVVVAIGLRVIQNVPRLSLGIQKYNTT